MGRQSQMENMEIKIPTKPIPITGPSITDLEIKYVTEAVKNGWFENCTKYIDEFEKKFANYVGTKYAIATSSCHGALHLGLAGLEIKSGDEVIMPDLTWVASAATVTYIGAKPVFVDIDPTNWCIDPTKIESAITPRTKAIMPVTMYGHPPAMKEIMAIAKKHKLYVIEDAAQAVGSRYYGKIPGSFGDYGAYSFHGTKVFSTGEGGMFVTNNKKLYEKVYTISNIGKHPKKPFWSIIIGLKYKMTNLEAALGLAQLQRIDELIAKKRLILDWYKEGLKGIFGISFNPELPHCFSNCWLTTIVFDKEYKIKKEKMVAELRKYNIIARPFFYPVTQLPPFKTKVNHPVSYKISAFGISPPCSHIITAEEVYYVCECIKRILKAKQR